MTLPQLAKKPTKRLKKFMTMSFQKKYMSTWEYNMLMKLRRM